MCLRQSAFEQFFDVNGDESESGCFVFLSSDASALRGTDYFMTLQDTVPANVVGTIVDATVQDLENFSAAGHLKTHVLPLAIMGYGKFESFCESGGSIPLCEARRWYPT